VNFRVPTTIPSKGALVASVDYKALEPLFIELHIQDSNWKWYGGGNVIVPAGAARSRISVQIRNQIPTDGATVSVFMNMKTLSAHLADSNSRPIQTLKKPVSVSSAITNTFQATNPASSNSVKIVKYPHVISAEKGVVEITVHYTATTPAYISSNVQQQAGSWQWYAGRLDIVPAGSGTLTIRILTNGNLPVDPAAKLGINVYQTSEQKYLATNQPWVNSDASVWVNVQAQNGGPAFARALATADQTFSENNSATTSAGLSTNMIVIIVVSALVCVVVVGAIGGLVYRHTTSRREEKV